MLAALPAKCDGETVRDNIFSKAVVREYGVRDDRTLDRTCRTPDQR